MKMMLEKASKTLTRLSDPDPIEKSPLCRERDDEIAQWLHE